MMFIVLGGLLLFCHCCCSAPSESALYITERKRGIYKMFLTAGTDTYMVEKPLADIFAIAHDPKRGFIYWTERNSGNERIGRIRMNTYREDFITLPKNADPVGLAVDYIANLLYLADNGNQNLYVIDYNQNSLKTFLKLVDYPPAIVVDSKEGWLYWSDFGKGISRIRTNGTEEQILNNDTLSYGLALDEDARRLYFCDDESIQSVFLNGSGRIIHYRGNFESYGHTCSITLDEENVYVTRGFGSVILKLSKFAKNANSIHTFYNSSCTNCQFQSVIFVNSALHKPVVPFLVRKCEDEGLTLELQCLTGLIEVEYANFGRTTNSYEVCPFYRHEQYNSDTCDRDKDIYTSHAKSLCNGKQSCLLRRLGLTDPCLRTYKYMEVIYICPLSTEIECPEVAIPSNGNVTYSGGRTMNDIVVYTCDDDYVLIGPSFRRCLSNSQWTAGTAVCHPNFPTTIRTLTLCQQLQSSVVTKKLESISQVDVTEQNAEEVAYNATTVLWQSSPQILQPQDINALTTTLENLAFVGNVDTKSIIGIINNIIDTNTSVVKCSQEEGNGITRVFKALENHAQSVNLGPSEKITAFQSNMAFAVWDASNLDALPGAYGTWQDVQKPFTDDKILAYKNSSQVNIAKTTAGILLSKEVFQLIASAHDQEQNPERPTRFSFSIYRKGDLFVAPFDELDGRQVIILSMIVAATVHNVDTSNLTEPIEIILKTNQKTSGKPICAYWDFDGANGQGNWSTEGCSYNATKDGRIICHCYHLTNFALIEFLERSTPRERIVLSIIFLIGLSLSMAGLLFPIVTYICFRQVRETRGQKVLFNLAVSLIAVNATFLAGVTAIDNEIVCKAVAASLQYLLLASFTWMVVEGTLLCLKLVKVLPAHIPRFMLKASVFGWGIPLVPVAVVAAIDHELFLASGQVKYCWLSPLAFVYAFLVPMGLLLTVIIISFSLVFVNFNCRTSEVMSSLTDWHFAKIVFSALAICFILHGFTWVFAFIALANAQVAFQYLFCVCNAFQGFFIIVFCIFRDPEVPQAWLEFFRRGKTQEIWSEHSFTQLDSTATWKF